MNKTTTTVRSGGQKIVSGGKKLNVNITIDTKEKPKETAKADKGGK